MSSIPLAYCQHRLHRQTLLLVGSHAAPPPFGTVFPHLYALLTVSLVLGRSSRHNIHETFVAGPLSAPLIPLLSLLRLTQLLLTYLLKDKDNKNHNKLNKKAESPAIADKPARCYRKRRTVYITTTRLLYTQYQRTDGPTDTFRQQIACLCIPSISRVTRSQAAARIADRTVRTASQHLRGSRDVIGRVTIWYSIFHFLLVVLWNHSPSVLWYCWLVFWPVKTVSHINYTVLEGT